MSPDETGKRVRRVRYFALWDEIDHPGVAKKIRQTVSAMRDAGHEADASIMLPQGLPTYLRYAWQVGTCAADVVILRFHPYLMPLLFPMLLLLRLRRRKIVIDVATPSVILLSELRDNPLLSRRGKWLRLLLLCLFTPWLMWPVSRVVQYAPESRYFMFGLRRKTVLSANGIRVADIPVISTPPSQRGEGITLIGVAALSDWHGYDLAMRGIAEYPGEGDQRLRLLIVGDGAIRASLEALAERLGIADRVEFAGVRHGAELDACFERAHIGLGSLALFRKNLDFASSLKSREYVARGLPFVSAGHDPDFTPPPDFVFMAPNSDVPLDTRALIDWYKALHAEPGLTGRLRAYAAQYLDFSGKIRTYLP